MNILINQESLDKFLSDVIDVNKYNLNSTFKLSSFVIEDKIGETIILYNAINLTAELEYKVPMQRIYEILDIVEKKNLKRHLMLNILIKEKIVNFQ